MATYSQVCSNVGSFTYGNRFTLYVVLTNRDGNPSTNKSWVDYNVYFENVSKGGTFTSNTRLYFAMNGGVIRDTTSSVTGPREGRVSIASGSMEVDHNNDGTKKIGYHALVNSLSFGIYGEISGEFILNTIPRASSISCSTANIESNPIVTITSASNSFTHSVYGYFGGLYFVVGTELGGGNHTHWTIPSSFYSQIPNSKSGTGTMICETYNGGALIGTTQTYFTVTTDEAKCKPLVSGTVKDSNDVTIGLTGNDKTLIKGISTAEIKVNPTARNSATIKRVTVNGLVISNNEASFTNVDTNKFEVIVTDSRDYSTIEPLTADMIPYLPVSLSATFFRPLPTTGEVSVRYSGNYFEGSFGTKDNSISIEWKYKEKEAEEWISGGIITPTIQDNKIKEETLSLGKIYDYQKEYEFQMTVSDELTIAVRTATVSIGIPVFNWGKDFFNVNTPSTFKESVDGKNVPVAQSPIIHTFDEVDREQELNKSGLYTAVIDDYYWYHLLNIRHRNGTGDGNKYGLQIRQPFDITQSLDIRSHHAGTWSSWHQIPKARTIFYNTSGTTGTVDLEEDAQYFIYMDIYFRRGSSSEYNMTRIIDPNNKLVSLINAFYWTERALMQLEAKGVYISGKTIVPQTDGYINIEGTSITSNGNVLNNATASIQIVKVVGYR